MVLARQSAALKSDELSVVVVEEVFSFQMEQRPSQIEADYSLKLSIHPVEIVYDEVVTVTSVTVSSFCDKLFLVWRYNCC